MDEGMGQVRSIHINLFSYYVCNMYVSQLNQWIFQTISCAAFDCDLLVDDATVMKLIVDKKVRARYQHLITNSFVAVKKILNRKPGFCCNFMFYYV